MMMHHLSERRTPHPQALGLTAVLLAAEEKFTENIMADSAKNYQLWNYRRKVRPAHAHAAVLFSFHTGFSGSWVFQCIFRPVVAGVCWRFREN